MIIHILIIILTKKQFVHTSIYNNVCYACVFSFINEKKEKGIHVVWTTYGIRYVIAKIMMIIYKHINDDYDLIWNKNQKKKEKIWFVLLKFLFNYILIVIPYYVYHLDQVIRYI